MKRNISFNSQTRSYFHYYMQISLYWLRDLVFHISKMRFPVNVETFKENSTVDSELLIKLVGFQYVTD